MGVTANRHTTHSEAGLAVVFLGAVVDVVVRQTTPETVCGHAGGQISYTGLTPFLHAAASIRGEHFPPAATAVRSVAQGRRYPAGRRPRRLLAQQWYGVRLIAQSLYGVRQIDR